MQITATTIYKHTAGGGRRSQARSLALALTLIIVALMASLAAPPLHAQTVTLNLKNADISALISTVAEVTGKNFIIDPRVKGKITVVSSKPMESEEIYQVFLSILDVHGFAVVPSGAVYKIVPDVNAKQSAIPNMQDDKIEERDQVVTRVIQVNNVSAAQLVPILRPLVPQQGHLAAYPSTNVLIISDRVANIERLEQIVRRMDQDTSGEIEVITLQHASATEVARVLSSLNKPTPGEAAPGGTGSQFIADERTNSVLMTVDRSQRLAMRAIIAHLDTPLASSGNTKVVYLHYAQAADMVAVLKGVGTTETQETKGGQPAAATKTAAFDVQADEATNALVISAPPDIMRSLESVIRQLDVRRAQVLVEAIIAEISTDKARTLGVQWAIDGSPDGNGPIGLINFSNGGLGIGSLLTTLTGTGTGTTTTAPTLPEGTAIGVGRINDDKLNYAALVQALASDGDTNILSTPSLLTLDNEEAEIVIGQNVPFVTGQFTNTGASGTAANPFQTIERQDVGLTLKIKPQINEGDSIKLTIEQEVSSLSPSTQASDVVTNKRSIKTAVLVDDGRMVVLGGLIEDNLTESVQKVPLLGDVPLLGYLFRSTRTNKGKTNLMVFIRPVILRDDAVAEYFSGGKYNYIRAKQLENASRGVRLMRKESPPVLPELEEMLDRSKVPASALPSEAMPGAATPEPAIDAAPAAP